MKNRFLLLPILALASAAALFAAPVNKLFDAAEKFQQAYSSTVESGETPIATFSRGFIESPNATGLQVYDKETHTLRNLSAFDLPVFASSATATLTSAAAATAVNLVPNTAVPAGKKCYLVDYICKVDGSTDWATTTSVKIQDTNASAVDFVTLTASTLDGNEVHGPWSDSATLENAFAKGTGGTAGKGLQIKGNANGTGSNLVVTVSYIIK